MPCPPRGIPRDRDCSFGCYLCFHVLCLLTRWLIAAYFVHPRRQSGDPYVVLFHACCMPREAPPHGEVVTVTIIVVDHYCTNRNNPVLPRNVTERNSRCVSTVGCRQQHRSESILDCTLANLSTDCNDTAAWALATHTLFLVPRHCIANTVLRLAVATMLY